MKQRAISSRLRAFSLIEMLIVLAVIGILAAIVISQIANATFETRRIVSRQQQVALQTAVSTWIMQKTTEPGQSLHTVRALYNTAGSHKARLELVKGYLDPDVYDHFIAHTSDATKVKSDAMQRINKWIELSEWTDTGYPQVQLHPVADVVVGDEEPGDG